MRILSSNRTVHNFSPDHTHSPNIMIVGLTVSEISSGQNISDAGRRKADGGRRTADGGRRKADGRRRTEIWNGMSLPEYYSGETKTKYGTLLT